MKYKIRFGSGGWSYLSAFGIAISIIVDSTPLAILMALILMTEAEIQLIK